MLERLRPLLEQYTKKAYWGGRKIKISAYHHRYQSLLLIALLVAFKLFVYFVKFISDRP